MPGRDAPQPTLDDGEDRAVFAKANDDGDKNVAAHGRILQAIEAPEEDRFAALEAERAPKRRGRKPGSKNKPKPGQGDDWAASLQVETPAIVERATPMLFARPETPFGAAESDDVGPSTAADDAPCQAPSLDDLPMTTARVRNDRFGWKRAGLRPGERWKRRLPKSAR